MNSICLIFFCLLACHNSLHNSSHFPHNTNAEKFWVVAKESAGGSSPTDKITTHSYHKMYGIFLVPLASGIHDKKIKLLEVGMGCNRHNGLFGKSVMVWMRLFGSNGDIWMAEFDEQCVRELKRLGRLNDINVLVGSQGNLTVVERWVNESGGNFDVIIDDGGHHNNEIWTTFNVLFFKALVPGGLYFIEDLQVGRIYGEENCGVISDIIQAWIDQLLIPDLYSLQASKARRSDPFARISATQSKNPPAHATRAAEMRNKYPLPDSIDWIFCQAEACVIAKKALD